MIKSVFRQLIPRLYSPLLNRTAQDPLKMLKSRRLSNGSGDNSDTSAAAEGSEESLQSKLMHTVLDLEEIDLNLYRTITDNLWKPVGARFVYGGQVVGQALVAASKTVPDNVSAHSLHSYFIRGGDYNIPIVYHVDRTRDGRSFCTRTVKATQKGEAIFTCQVSFHESEVSTLDHQSIMPAVPKPEELSTDRDLLWQFLGDQNLCSTKRDVVVTSLAQELPIEIKPVHPEKYFRLKKSDPLLLRWIRAKGKLDPDNRNLHCCVAAYISDLAFLPTALMPHQPGFEVGMMVSLDHTLWFHEPFQADEWMLYESHSPQAAHGRAFILGKLWKADGDLAVSVAQEGLIRAKM